MQLSERHTRSGEWSPVHLLRQQRWQHSPCCQRRRRVHAHTPDSYVYHEPCWQKRAKYEWWVMHAGIPSGTKAISFCKGHCSLSFKWDSFSQKQLLFSKMVLKSVQPQFCVEIAQSSEVCCYFIYLFSMHPVLVVVCGGFAVHHQWKTQLRHIFINRLVNLCCCQHLWQAELSEHAARTVAPKTSRVKKTLKWNERFLQN